MKNTASAPAPEYFIDNNGIRWLNVKPRKCKCADCEFERKHNITLRTRKQCEA